MAADDFLEGDVVAVALQRGDNAPAAAVDWQDLVLDAVRDVDLRLAVTSPPTKNPGDQATIWRARRCIWPLNSLMGKRRPSGATFIASGCFSTISSRDRTPFARKHLAISGGRTNVAKEPACEPRDRIFRRSLPASSNVRSIRNPSDATRAATLWRRT